MGKVKEAPKMADPAETQMTSEMLSGFSYIPPFCNSLVCNISFKRSKLLGREEKKGLGFTILSSSLLSLKVVQARDFTHK